MNKTARFTVSEYAKLKNISEQAVYKQIKQSKLQVEHQVENGKKRLYIVISDTSAEKDDQPAKQEFNNQDNQNNQPDNQFLEYLKAENDRLIKQNKSLEERNEELQRQNSELTLKLLDLASNAQTLADQAQKLHALELNQGNTEPEHQEIKKGFFKKLFGRNKESE